VVLHLHPKLAPVQVGVYPLVKKDGMPERARAIYDALKEVLRCTYDESATVGKRYARGDEIGTPWGVTIDSQTLTDGTVTVRDRDSMAQERVPERELLAYLLEKKKTWARVDDGGPGGAA
jgi:glycyl-tRNA synthetase